MTAWLSDEAAKVVEDLYREIDRADREVSAAAKRVELTTARAIDEAESLARCAVSHQSSDKIKVAIAPPDSGKPRTATPSDRHDPDITRRFQSLRDK